MGTGNGGSEVWSPGEKAVNKKLEAAQDKVSKQLLGASMVVN